MKRSGRSCVRAALAAVLLVTFLGAALTATATAAETVANQPARLNTLVLDRLPRGTATLSIFVWEGSSFTLQQGWRGALPVASARLATGDFSGDGLADGAVLTPLAKKGARLSLFTAAPGSGSFTLTVAWKSARSPFSARLAKLACGDVTGDGRDDLVVLAPKGKRGVQLLLFMGAAASWTAPTVLWSAASSPFTVSSAQLACGDLDGDGKSDVIILGRSGNAWTLRGLRSDGTHAAPQWTDAAPVGAAKLAAGDVTADGKAEALILAADGGATSSISLLSATGSGFSSAPYGAAPVKASAAQLAVSDLTGDGRADAMLLTVSGGGRVFTAPATDEGYAFETSWRASGSQSLSAPRLACAPMLPVVLDADTKVLSSASAAALAAVSESGTLTFDEVTPQVAALAAGDILIAGACDAAPEGLLAKVTTVESGGGTTTAATTAVPMEEAVESLDVSYEGEVSVSDLGRPSYLRPGVHLISAGERGGLNTLSMTWSINCDLDGVKAGGSIGLSQRFDLDFKIAHWKLKSARFTETTTQTSSLTLTASTAWEKSKKYVLASYPLPIIDIQAGPVPVTIHPSLEIYVGATGKLEIGITTSVNEQASLTTGVAYDSSGFHPIAEPSASATFTPPTLYGSASLKGYAAVKLATRLYSLAGPYAAVEGYGELTADTRANPWWRLHAGLDAKLGFDVKVLTWSVADWSLEKNILDWQVAAADGAYPGTPTPTPSPTPTPTPSRMPGNPFPIFTGVGWQHQPAISGNTVVWSDDHRDDNIYGYDLAKKREFPICTAAGSQTEPAISGNTVVWTDARSGDPDIGHIYGYDLAKKREFPICTAAGSQTEPAISGNTVVWTDYRNGNFDIYGYDLAKKREFPICTAAGDQLAPAISGNTVVWQDGRNNTYFGGSGYDIYGYDMAEDRESPICTATGNQGSPSISGNTVVWSDNRRWGDIDIYGFDLAEKRELPICTAPSRQSSPVISGNTVVWVDNRRTGDWGGDLYGYDLAQGRELPICTVASSPSEYTYSPAIWADTVVWEDDRDDMGDIYGVTVGP